MAARLSCVVNYSVPPAKGKRYIKIYQLIIEDVIIETMGKIIQKLKLKLGQCTRNRKYQ